MVKVWRRTWVLAVPPSLGWKVGHELDRGPQAVWLHTAATPSPLGLETGSPNEAVRARLPPDAPDKKRVFASSSFCWPLALRGLFLSSLHLVLTPPPPCLWILFPSPSFIYLFKIKKKNWMCWIFLVALELVALKHVGSQFLNQGSNPHPLHWKADS